MSRTPAQLRYAVVADAPRLVDLWSEVVRRAEPAEQIADMERVIERATHSLQERLLVAAHDGELVGAVLLQSTTMSPVNTERVVRVVNPFVFPEFRRRGIGQLLIDAGVSFAEELGVAHVATASASSWRDANRFMARLGLGQHAVLRVAPTHAVRSRLTALRPTPARPGSRHLDRVLASRRGLRREGTAG